ncbi:MAG: hypothetical protein VX246_11725 [Myxococcota bacterium]|nr:hypothetical protein [Myxococcota bacterium]
MDIDLRGVVATGDAVSGSSGVPDDDVLIALSDAVTRGDSRAAESARDALRQRLGDGALVDAAAVVATFNTMDRIADGSGIPLDAVLVSPSRSFREELGLGRFASAANTPGAENSSSNGASE